VTGRRGFTILEALLAFSIAAFSLALLAQAVAQMSRAAAVASKTQSALSFAENRIASLGNDQPLRVGRQEGFLVGNTLSFVQVVEFVVGESDQPGPIALTVRLEVYDNVSGSLVVRLETIKIAERP
jgi:type II secretory pathway pseudopilin PulG